MNWFLLFVVPYNFCDVGYHIMHVLLVTYFLFKIELKFVLWGVKHLDSYTDLKTPKPASHDF